MKRLVVDVGNTSTSIGYYTNGVVTDVGRCVSRFTNAPETVFPLLKKHSVQQIVIATVVPEVVSNWEDVCHEFNLPAPLWVHPSLELGVDVDYPDPTSIGPDRLANAAAAAKLLGTPSVICDFGTALTFDVLQQDRGYIGGIICPGLPLMFDYLAERTALLPEVKASKTTAVVGRNTCEAMQVGARLGYRGMVREVLNALREDLNAPDLTVCCTGGYADWIFEGWDVSASIDIHLTLKGLGIIGELNS